MSHVRTTPAGVLLPAVQQRAVFSTIVTAAGRDAEQLTFSNTSALSDSDLVMIDRETGSYWWQVAGRSIVGTLSGVELPSSTMAWRD
jgi:hypothetical protein